jgi:hypothetical protein
LNLLPSGINEHGTFDSTQLLVGQLLHWNGVLQSQQDSKNINMLKNQCLTQTIMVDAPRKEKAKQWSQDQNQELAEHDGW